ncbi:phage tail tape measure protein [Psychrobacter celer]|uniref:phage tail tape measure protein n=1 Tax=Psychrobacter celer TaxID=306572 RepID=UPI003FD4CB9E
MANLDLSVQLKAFDSVSKKFEAINRAGKKLAEGFDKNVKALAKLDGQMKNIRSYEKLKKAMDDNGRAMTAAREKARALQQQLQNSGADRTAAQMRALRTQYNQATADVGRLESRQNRYRQSLGQTRNALRDAGINTRNLSSEQARLQDHAANLNRTLTEQSQRLERLSQAQQRQQQASGQYQNMMGKRNQAIGLAMGGAAATYAGARFIGPGLQLEQNLSEVQALTRLDKNSPQYKALAEQARQLGAATAFTSADAAAGQSFLAMAGFTPESIKAAMPGMLDLALAGKIDLPATADIASNILSGMSLDPTKDMGKIGDVLSAAFTRANLNIGMLGETMKYAAPGASALGVSLEELAGMSGKLGDAGIQGSEGGTALRAIMQRLAGQPKDVADAMKELGVHATDAYGNLRPMPDILKDIHEVTQGMGNAEMMAYLSDISGLNASGAMVKLVEYAGNGELQTLIADLQGSQGELAKLSKTMGDNTMGDWKGTTSAIDGFRTAIFDANSESLRELLKNVTNIAQKMTAWAQANPELVSTMGKIFGILAIGAVVIGSIGAVLLTILGPMALLRASFSTLGGVAGIFSSIMAPLKMLWSFFGLIGQSVVSAIALIGKSLMFLVNIMKVVGAAMMANPILIAITLLAVAAFLIWQNWGPIKEFFIGLWASISAGAQALWASITATWQSIVTTVTAWAQNLWAQLTMLFSAGIQALISVIMNFTPVGLFIQAFAAVWSYLSGLSATFFTYGANMLEGLKNGIMSRAAAVVEGIRSVASQAKSAFTGLMGIRSPSRVFMGYGGFMMQGLSGGILSNADRAIKATQWVSDKIKKHAPDSFGARVIDTVQSATTRIRDRDPIRFGSYPPLVSASSSMGGAAMSQAPSNITIQINGATDPHAVAMEVKRVLADQQRNQQARNRRRLTD